MESERYREIIEIITDNCIQYMDKELGIKVISKKIYLHDVTRISLDYLSSIVTIEGHINSLLAFSYQRQLIDKLCSVFTEGLDIDEEEEDIYLEETASEISNIIIGNATAKLEKPDSLLRMTPPFVIKEAKNLITKKDARFYHSIIATEQGNLNLYLILQEQK